MTQIPIEELLRQCPSIYKLVVIAARRAMELSEGAPKLIETDLNKVTGIALEEIRQGKVLYRPEEAKEAKGERKAKERAVKPVSAARAAHGRGKKRKS